MKGIKLGVRNPRMAKSGPGHVDAPWKRKGPVLKGQSPAVHPKSSTITPKGAPGRKSGTTTPKLGKQMSVADVLNFKFPSR